jgi:DNA-binding MarR family transcriptional regulator
MPEVRKKPTLIAERRHHRSMPVGAMLRVTYQMIRERQFAALIDRGFNDLNQALLNVMVYPFPDGAHPSDLAARTNMTKQATNHLLGRLETLGYVERRAEKRRSSTLVFLTRRGKRAVETVRDAASQVGAEWATILGQKRFSEFLDTLRQLSSGDTHAGGDPASPRR